jgi:hypothetical protein
MNYLQQLAEQIGEEQAQQLEELASAFLLKTKCDPRKCVLIQHVDYQTGKTYSWFEKKRGRSRKEILENIKKQ